MSAAIRTMYGRIERVFFMRELGRPDASREGIQFAYLLRIQARPRLLLPPPRQTAGRRPLPLLHPHRPPPSPSPLPSSLLLLPSLPHGPLQSPLLLLLPPSLPLPATAPVGAAARRRRGVRPPAPRACCYGWLSTQCSESPPLLLVPTTTTADAISTAATAYAPSCCPCGCCCVHALMGCVRLLWAVDDLLAVGRRDDQTTRLRVHTISRLACLYY